MKKEKILKIDILSVVEKVRGKEFLRSFNHKNLTEDDINKVCRKASSAFSPYLSQNEIESCILNALWKALKKYDHSKKTKFTSYLHNGVVMECLTQKKFNTNTGSPTYRIHDNISSFNNTNIDRIDMLDELNECCEDPEIIYDRFYRNMTVREIAKSRGVCSETIRVKINKNLSRLGTKLKSLSV